MHTVSFRQMKDGTKAEYLFLGRLERDHIARLARSHPATRCVPWTTD